MEPAQRPTSTAIGRHVSGLDGMRAVGMGVMMLFHAQLSAKGAFLALSQFFTLSGFLIVALLIRRLESDERVSLVDFWGRRYRRLMPASLVTLAGILVFGATIATEQQVDAIRRGVLATLAQVVNWQFVFADVSYVEQFQSPSPIQHFWSLAVEEQFYLIIPVLMVVVFRVTRSIPAITIVFATLAAASSGLMFVLFENGVSIDRLYYGTDTRASEMLVGGVLALLLHQFPPRLTERARLLVGWAGMTAYGLSVWAFFTLSLTDARMYRGGLLVYSLLTCIVIFSLVVDGGPLGRIIGWRPIAATGRITYGIYLIHWPLILTLTEERIGFGGWPLFLGVQTPVIIGLASLSARFFEKPIRYSRPSAGDFRFPAAVALALTVVAAGALLLAWRDVETDLAGLGEEISAPPTTAPESDAVPSVLVVGDADGLLFADQLDQASRGADPQLEIVGRLPFSADRTELTELIEDVDPDVVLFHVDTWPLDDLRALAATDDIDALTLFARTELERTFDVLTERGANVAWGFGERDIAEGLRAAADPFNRAMEEITKSRSDVRAVGVAIEPDEAAAALRTYARAGSAGLRVLVVGDSVSRTIGYGLESWARDTGTALVWSAGTEGCGVARGGWFTALDGREFQEDAVCAGIPDAWADQLADFDPDLVVVVSNVVDFRERRLDEWSKPLQPGDELFDTYLIDQYVEAVDLLSAQGAAVTWVQSPCAIDELGLFDEPDGESPVDAERIRYVNEEILGRLQTERPDVQMFDLYSRLCPDDVFVNEIDGITAIRPDGVHFSAEGAIWLAETYGAELLAN